MLLDLFEESLLGFVAEVEFLTESLDDFVRLVVLIDLDLFNMFAVELNLEDANGLLDLRWIKVINWSFFLLVVDHVWGANFTEGVVQLSPVRVVSSTRTIRVEKGAWLDLWSLEVGVTLVVAVWL